MSNRYWNKYEAALLIETYLKVKAGGNRHIEVQLLSDTLRAIALSDGEIVSESFRNYIGIDERFSFVSSIFAGKHTSLERKPGQIFIDMVYLYNHRKDSFNAILAEAHRKINASNLAKEAGVNYMEDFDLPFDDNLSERDLRPIKLKKKVSGCHRAFEGLKDYCNIRTIISTCIKQGICYFETIKNIITNKKIVVNKAGLIMMP